MIFCRYEYQGETFAGVLHDGLVQRICQGDSLVPAFSSRLAPVTQDAVPLECVRLLAPLADAPNVFCVASNYSDHARETRGEQQKSRTTPWFFLKPRGTMAGPESEIVIPSESPHAIDWECELAVVIGRPGKHIAPAEAGRHIAGFTVFIDYSDRKFRPLAERDERPWDSFFDWLHGKWHDGFSAMGPFLVSPDAMPASWSELSLHLSVNGVLRQDSSTRNMIFSPAELISFLSRIVTLRPGDLISTGTPGGVAATLNCPYLQPGDLVEAEISGIGTLRNRMVAESAVECR
jgi:2-keto-4-pentenoate hydratase/2-oxohepta-3-ene-1,7-dioic acid hydratase in catechol pathway